jgi:hypothetical protein
MLKLGSPLYAPVTVREPAVAEAMEQVPVPLESVIVQLLVPSETATVPVGMPL